MPKIIIKIYLQEFDDLVDVDFNSPTIKKLKLSDESHVNHYFQKMMQLIEQNNIASLKQLLPEFFILESFGRLAQHRYNPEKNKSQTIVCAKALVQPMIEIIFLHHRDKFLLLLENLKNEPECAKIFLDYLNKTDLSPLVKKWDVWLRLYIEEGIIELRAHSKKLKEEKDQRGNRIETLINALEKEIPHICPKGTYFPEDAGEEKESKADDKTMILINRLIHKIQFMTQLHQHDAEFSIHRKPEKVIAANVGIGLLLGGGLLYPLACSIHHHATQRYTFFSRTKTEEFIDNIHLKIDPYRQIKIL